MKIQDHSFQLYSQSNQFESLRVQQTKEPYQKGGLQSAENKTMTMQTRQSSEHFLGINQSWPKARSENFQTPSAQATDLIDRQGTKFLPANASPVALEASGKSQLDAPKLPPKLEEMARIIESMMTYLFKKEYRIEVYGYQRSAADSPSNPEMVPPESPELKVANVTHSAQENPGPSIEQDGVYEAQSIQYKFEESMTFKANGKITTEEGREIKFSLNSQMAQSFEFNSFIERSEGLVLRDPLVVSFDQQPAQMSLEKIQFDLEADQVLEEIPLWRSGSGYLALDRNDNGRIDDGSELFGTQSGDGFADLRAYDEDQNGWIDENDAVFAQLKVWHQTGEGLQQLDGLLEVGIGAIYLDAVKSDYHYRDAQLNPTAKIQQSSVMLMEDGRVGTVQQIDLSV
jgi:hypothetical protein